MRDSILCLIIGGSALNIVICDIQSCISEVWLSVFLAFMMRTRTASMMFCLSILISFSSFESYFSSSTVPFFFYDFTGTKLHKMFGLWNSLKTLIGSLSKNSELFRFYFDRIIFLGLHKYFSASLSSSTGIPVIGVNYFKVNSGWMLNKRRIIDWKVFICKM